MKEEKFLEELKKIIPDLVYSDSLLDSESIEIPIYYAINDDGEVLVDFDSIREEFENKLNMVSKLLSDDKDN